MTSSNEPPLTRRELRERERLREQQAASSTPDTAQPFTAPSAPTAAPAVPPQAPAVPAPQPATPAPQPVNPQFAAPVQAAAAQVAPSPSYAPPRPAGGFDAVLATPQAPTQSQVPQQNPFAPQPVTPIQAVPPVAAPVPVIPAPANPIAAASALPVESAPTASAAPASPQTPERTLTRRELRAMLEGSALDEFDGELDSDDVPGASQAVPSPQAAHPQVVHPQTGLPLSSTHPAPPAPPQTASPLVLPGSQAAMPASLATPIDQVPTPAPSAPAYWTTQLDVPDDEPSGPFDQLLSRGSLSHGVPTTTNALILPSLPDSGAFGDSLAQSGEVLATGSIDLPRSYGATGVHPSQIDSSDVDRLFDSVEEVGTGVAPVAATSAISTQGAARTMMAPPKKEGMNVPLVLAVTAGVLALGVVGTLVIGAMSGLF